MTNGLFGWLTFAPAFELQLNAVSILAKVTIVLLIAAIASLALRNASPALRHRVWLTAIVASVLMPAFAFLPSVSVELPSAAYLVQPRTNGVPVKASVTADRTTEPSPRAEARGPQTSSPSVPATNSRFRINSGYSSFFPANKPSVRMYRDRDGSFHYAEPRMVPEKAFGNASVVQKEKKSINLWMVGFALWAGGSILLLAWRVCGYALLSRMIAECKSFSDPAWQRDLERLTSRSGRARTVRLLQHPSLRSPVTAGWLHPVIMLPEVASTMLADERRAVLAHELSHIERSDFVTQAVGSFATSLFWFHPLIWLAVSRMRTESECAADDSVLMSGLDAPSYARQLVQMAKETNAFGADVIPVVAMARTTQLERRIRLLLNASRRRQTFSSRWNRVVTVLSAFAIVPIGSIAITPSTSKDSVADAPADSTHSRRRESLTDVANERRTQTPTAVAQTPVADVDSIRDVLQSALRYGAGSGYVKLPESMFASDSVVEQTLPMEAGESVALQLLSGARVIVHGWNESRAVMRASFAGPAWRQASARMERTPRGIYIGSVSTREGYRVLNNEAGYAFARTTSDSVTPMPPSVDHLIEVWLPKRSKVDLRSVLGPVTVQDFEGEMDGKIEYGDLHIANATGRSSIMTMLGNIEVKNSNLTGGATTACGTVRLTDVSGTFNATTAFDPEQFNNTMATKIVIDGMFPGDYCNPRLRRLAALPNRVDESQPYGDIVIDSAPNGGKLSTGRGGSIVVRSSDAHISALTSNGKIELRNVRGDATARSNGGEITISLVNTNRVEHYVNVQNVNGNVIIELPDSVDANVTVELTTTDAYRARTKRSAQVIDQYGLISGEPATESGPQRTLMLAGNLKMTRNNGLGRIIVQVTDGDVTFRRARR